MAIVVPAAGEVKLMEFALGKSVPGDQSLKLYVNDYTPVAGSVAGSFTEMSTHGYAAKPLTKANWAVAQNGAAEGEGSYVQQVWAFTAAAAQPVYGYFVIDSTSGVVLWAERFTSPPVIQFAGDVIRVTPVITGAD